MSEAPTVGEPARVLMRLKRFYDGNNDEGTKTWNAAIQACVDALATLPVVPRPTDAQLLDLRELCEWANARGIEDDVYLTRASLVLTLPVGDVEPRSSLSHESGAQAEAMQRPVDGDRAE